MHAHYHGKQHDEATLSPLVGIFSPSPTTTGLTSSTANKPQSGVASVYGGDRTASGQRMKAGGMTAAHRTLPFGTSVTVVNSQNGLAVVVRITDRARADYRFEPGGGACDRRRRPCAGIVDGGKWQLARRVLSVAWSGLRGGMVAMSYERNLMVPDLPAHSGDGVAESQDCFRIPCGRSRLELS